MGGHPTWAYRTEKPTTHSTVSYNHEVHVVEAAFQSEAKKCKTHTFPFFPLCETSAVIARERTGGLGREKEVRTQHPVASPPSSLFISLALLQGTCAYSSSQEGDGTTTTVMAVEPWKARREERASSSSLGRKEGPFFGKAAPSVVIGNGSDSRIYFLVPSILQHLLQKYFFCALMLLYICSYQTVQ